MKYLVIMLYINTKVRSYAKLIIRFSIVLDVYFEFKYQDKFIPNAGITLQKIDDGIGAQEVLIL